MLKSQYRLAQNVRLLLERRGETQADLAKFCGHSPPWLSKLLAGDRGVVRCADLDCIADFFGLDVPTLFQWGIAPVLERRQGERRQGERRKPRD